MKIGIMTHHYVNNFGAFLQAYCLKSAVAELFPDDEVIIINYVNRKHLIINIGGYFRFYKGRETVKSWLQKNKMPGVFAKARKDHMNLSKTIYSVSDVNALNCDVIIVGSDEVWNYRDSKSYNAIKFGAGIDAKTRLVSYAACVGGARDFSDRPKQIDDLIKRFSALSSRDDNTSAFVREITGETVTRVTDPVFLHKVPSGLTNRVLGIIEKPYMLFYHCAPMSEKSRAGVIAYAKEKGLKLIGAGEYDAVYDEMTQDLTPFEWSELFRHADYVLTGTFHGAVFSIINSRVFSVCPNNPTRAEKLASLLGEFGLSARLAKPESFDINAAAAQTIDYAKTARLIEEKVKISKDYIKDAVCGKRVSRD